MSSYVTLIIILCSKFIIGGGSYLPGHKEVPGMTIANHERLHLCLRELRDGIKPHCEETWKCQYGDNWLQIVKDKFKSYDRGRFKNYDRLESTKDLAFLLKAIIEPWHEVWNREFGDLKRNFVLNY